jgi:hypothetical protein
VTLFGIDVQMFAGALVAGLVVGVGNGLATLRAGKKQAETTTKAIDSASERTSGDVGAHLVKLERAMGRMGREVKQLRQRVDAVAPSSPVVLARQGRGPLRARRRGP